MEECESLDTEMTELQEFQCGSPQAVGQDDEDEVEELHNSLREVVQDPLVKPKLQCLMVDPSFSMVTVQSEDSGIVWETASSRCSTPWASETSSISESYSMEGSGAQGKITIIFDEDKIVRRRKRLGGRSSRLGDRLRRPGSSRSGSALGVERPEMAEISIPNVKPEATETGSDMEEIKDKEQQLFSLISEGYEILNIRVPSKLPTVDEEESTELQDNLTYLNQTPKIKSKNHHIRDGSQTQNQHLSGVVEVEILEPEGVSKQDSSHPSTNTETSNTHAQKENAGDMDYFEKFTLLDEVVPGEQVPELHEEVGRPQTKSQAADLKLGKEMATDSPSMSDESFVFVTDMEIANEHLDEVFYGNGAHSSPNELLQGREEEDINIQGRKRARRESQRSLKETGSVLFESEETVLTPIFLSSGPPKIIDPILLEEPTAMSFMYTDLYEDAVGEKRKSDEEYSEAGSVASERSFKRHLSDSEEADGYLEKFILKDETPTVEVLAEPEEDKKEERMIWSQSKFEMTGCLTKAVEEAEEDEVRKGEPVTEEADATEARGNVQSTKYEREEELVIVTETKREEIKPPEVMEEQAAPNRTGPGQSVQVPEPQEDKIEDQEVKQKVKDQSELLGSSTQTSFTAPETSQVGMDAEKSKEMKEHLEEEPAKPMNGHGITETQLPSVTRNVMDKSVEVVVKAKDEITAKVDSPVSIEVPQVVSITEVQRAAIKVDGHVSAPLDNVKDTTHIGTEDTKERWSKEAALDTAIVAADKKLDRKSEMVPAKDEVPVKDKEPETLSPEITKCAKPLVKTEISAEALVDGKTFVAENEASVRVITDSEPAVQAAVEVVEKALNENVILTKEQTALQALLSSETTEVQAVEEEKRQESEEMVIDRHLAHSITESVAVDLKSEFKPQILSQIMDPSIPDEVKLDTDEKLAEVPKSDQSQQEEMIPGKESEKTELPPEEIKDKTIPAYNEKVVQETVNVGDELFLLVPKGKAVEMDIEIGQWSEKFEKTDTEAVSEPESAYEELVSTNNTLVCPESPQPTTEDILEEHEQEANAKVIQIGEVLPIKVLDRWPSPPATVSIEEAETEEQKTNEDMEDDEGVVSPLRSFTPLEDLSWLQEQDKSEGETKREDVVQETDINWMIHVPETDKYKEDVGLEMYPNKEATEGLEVTAEDLEYEVISKQDAREMPEVEVERVAEVPQPESGPEKETVEIEEHVLDLPDDELIEADYDIIDSEEESQARAAAELQGLDWFCLICGCLLSEEDYVSGEHHGHEVTSVDKAYEDIKDRLSEWISVLQERSENIEDLVSELELAYNSVEDQCAQSEEAMQAQNEEMMALVMEQYNTMSLSMEEEKKAKLEQLYDQIVSFQENIDSAKGTLEVTAREAETDARVSDKLNSPEDINTRLNAALECVMSLELGPKGLLVFEDYAKGNTSNSHMEQRKGIPVPQRPTLQPQEAGSATSTNVTVYWRVNPGDIIDCFQVYCMEDPHGAVSEEYRVTVKESYCVLEELEPDKTYKVWVMAVNYTGCSLPSERLSFRTAPSVPVIDTERCSVLWDSATLCWSSAQQTPCQSYTLEYCRQYELEGEGLRSISSIRGNEQKVFLQPNENYLFYIKAVNEAGASEQSEAALISTKGTKFHLLKASGHPFLELSEEQTSVRYYQDIYDNTPSTDRPCPSILGQLLPTQGRYYWETIVMGSAAYRLGVSYEAADRNSPLGKDSKSWCLHCIPTPSSCRYQMLHNDVQSDVFAIEIPKRVGTLLDYQQGHLSFYNADNGQLLGTFNHVTLPCHPALGLEMPGSLEVCMIQEVPEFTNHS
ncbi:cardiomyopathy-associated protein 5 [Lampris incognitus]|uniref:cardiomyopathy-associated protein 5 n=1 Tax=Lampris incognitus TaxID=2546036 RepID=UPI0024B5ACBB|nr:cardiomyopathy-associated protein 5 [Lampris incognitus]